MPGTSAAEALTHFDRLVKVFCEQGGDLSRVQKRMLDESLAVYAAACEKLNLPAHKDHSSRVVLPRSDSDDEA